MFAHTEQSSALIDKNNNSAVRTHLIHWIMQFLFACISISEESTN